MKRFRIERWDIPYRGPADTARTNSLDTAQLLAGEWLAFHPDSIVYVRAGTRRFRATLTESMDVRFAELFSDGVLEFPASAYEARRVKGYTRLLAREEKRRQRKRSELEARQAEEAAERAGKFGHGRPVVCLDNAMPFASAEIACRWVGVVSTSAIAEAIGRGGKCGRLRWQYADVLLGGKDHGSDRAQSRALREAAEQAMLLRKRAEVQAVPRHQAAPEHPAPAEPANGQ